MECSGHRNTCLSLSQHSSLAAAATTTTTTTSSSSDVLLLSILLPLPLLILLLLLPLAKRQWYGSRCGSIRQSVPGAGVWASGARGSMSFRLIAISQNVGLVMKMKTILVGILMLYTG